jgi:RNA polymerase sigma-70 factor (ECF subfamily)
LRYTKSQSEAEDVIQDSFIKVFDKIREFKRKSKLETWLTRIVINTALNSQRSKLYMFPMADVNEINLEDEISLARFEWQDLLKMIQSLPSGCQAIFNLFAIEGYNHNEIAEMLSISEGTSKSQYSRAKILLKELISKNEMVRYERA